MRMQGGEASMHGAAMRRAPPGRRSQLCGCQDSSTKTEGSGRVRMQGGRDPCTERQCGSHRQEGSQLLPLVVLGHRARQRGQCLHAQPAPVQAQQRILPTCTRPSPSSRGA